MVDTWVGGCSQFTICKRCIQHAQTSWVTRGPAPCRRKGHSIVATPFHGGSSLVSINQNAIMKGWNVGMEHGLGTLFMSLGAMLLVARCHCRTATLGIEFRHPVHSRRQSAASDT